MNDDKPGRCLLIEGDAKLNFRPIAPHVLKSGAVEYRDLVVTCTRRQICPFLYKFGRCPTGDEVLATYSPRD